MSDDQHPYSLAYERDGVVYVSGAVGLDENGAAVMGDRECLDAAMGAVSKRLQSVGLTLDSVAKTTYFATEVALRDHANRQYEELFAHPRPARTFVVVADLPYGARIAIEAIAHR